MPSKKTKKADSTGEVLAQSSKLEEEFQTIKRELEDLRSKLGLTKRSDLTKLPMDAARKVGDTASEIIKTASDVVEKALKVVQYAAVGAVEGGKKALKEEVRQKKSKKS
ncbi:MAG: hypothetical protein ACT4NX_04365 [Deltaproteobacteria bacterium]